MGGVGGPPRRRFAPFNSVEMPLRSAGTNFPPKISSCGVQGQKFGVKARQFLQKHQRKGKDMPPPETTKLEIPEWTGSGLSNGDHLAYAKDLA